MLQSFVRSFQTTPLARGLSAKAGALTYLEPAALISILRSKDAGKTVVLDVREEGYDERHIKGAVSVKDSVFDAQVHSVAQQLQDKEQVVLHCAHSLRRGPRCASQLVEHLEAHGLTKPQVLVLKGGYDHFYKEHGASGDLFSKK